MPELPDITVYIEALERRILNEALSKAQLFSPFLLRTAAPPLQAIEGQKVMELRRVGKRIALRFANEIWLVIHLMIAGRLHWLDPGKTASGRGEAKSVSRAPRLAARQAILEFASGLLVLTEAGTQRRAAIHLAQGEAGLRALDPGGLEVMGCSLESFAGVLAQENHTLKRALTDPHLFSGIGNAYSDEILHRARLSPVALTQKLSGEQIRALHTAVQETLVAWVERLRAEAGDDFPQNLTAFRPEMAVHGKFGQPCPVCGAKIQRIRYAQNETNYCPTCQTGGKLLADRSLSLLLKRDWPATPTELEEMRAAHAARQS